MQSEAVLVGLLVADYSPGLLITVASVGNVLGSVINWLLGRGIERFRDRPWFPASGGKLERAQRWYTATEMVAAAGTGADHRRSAHRRRRRSA